MKVHLADGTYDLFRAFFGTPPAVGHSGQPVGAVRGLLATLIALLREKEVTHVACAFDTVIESFRNELFDGYKTGEGIDPALSSQFELAERAARALGIVVWSMLEFEADDALATGAERYKADPRVEQVVICSPDKDLAQSVDGDRVVCLDRRRSLTYDADRVREKFGVSPASIPDWLALVGDAADGLPGVPRWGAKSSATVLAHYQHIEAIPADPASWEVSVRGAPSLALNLVHHRESALLYRHLATLSLAVPLPETVDDLEWKGAYREPLEQICDEIGDRALLDRVTRFR